MGIVPRFRPSSVIFGALLGWGAAGCTPTCSSACRQLLDCHLDASHADQDECVASCQAQRQLFREWDDDEKKEAFAEQLRCIGSSTCEEIDDGVCYTEDMYVF